MSTYATDNVHGQTVVATVQVGGYPLVVAVNSVTDEIYVPNFNGQTVSLINGTKNTVVATISDVGLCGALACRPQGPGRFVNQLTNRIYVSTGQGDSVIVIDGTTNTVMTTISLFSIGCGPFGVAVNEGANTVYVGCGGRLAIIDGETNTVIGTIAVAGATFVAFNPATNRIYVAGGSNVTVIDATTNTVTTTIPANATQLDVDAATNRIYAASHLASGEPAVLVIDGSSNTLIATIPVAGGADGVSVDPATNKIYVSGGGGSSVVSIIDGATNAVVATVPLSNTSGVAVNPSTNLIYVTQAPANQVVVISWLEATVSSTSATVNCNPPSVAVSDATSCTTTVTDTSPTPSSPSGTVSFSSSGSGSFSPSNTCKPSSTSSSTSSCSASYTANPGSEGMQTITATYSGDASHREASGTTSPTVTKRTTLTMTSCSKIQGGMVCTVTVTDTSPGAPIAPIGTVAWQSSGTGTFSPASCSLSGKGSSATCTVTYAPVEGSKARIVTITGTYSSDTDHVGSSGSTTIKVSS